MSHISDDEPNRTGPEYVARLVGETAAIVERTRIAVEESRRLVERTRRLQGEWRLIPWPAGRADRE